MNQENQTPKQETTSSSQQAQEQVNPPTINFQYLPHPNNPVPETRALPEVPDFIKDLIHNHTNIAPVQEELDNICPLCKKAFAAEDDESAEEFAVMRCGHRAHLKCFEGSMKAEGVKMEKNEVKCEACGALTPTFVVVMDGSGARARVLLLSSIAE